MPILPPDRKPHYLRRNHGESVPLYHVAVDTEAFRDRLRGKAGAERQELSLGCAVGWTIDPNSDRPAEWCEFTTRAEFWSWLDTWAAGLGNVCLWGHNLGYDLTLLDFWGLLTRHVWSVFSPTDLRKLRQGQPADPPVGFRGLCVVEDPPTIVVARRQGVTLTCCDTFNYWQLPLSKLGAWVGLDKLELPAADADLWTWRQYCRRDVQIVQHVITRLLCWWQANHLGNWGWTAPSLAWRSYRHRFLKSRVLVDANEHAAELGRAAYVGGEVYSGFVGQFGLEPAPPPGTLWRMDAPPPGHLTAEIHVLDVESCYAGVMATEQFPRQLLGVYAAPSLRALEGWQCNRCVVAEVFLDSPEDTYPVLVGKERYFARGKLHTTLCGPELARALRAGHVVRCRKASVYAPGRILRDFALWWWQVKAQAEKDGDQVTRHLAKLVLNALVGRFGERRPTWEHTRAFVAGQGWGAVARIVDGVVDKGKYRAIAGYLQEAQERMETKDSMPVIAAFVTSCARERLRDLRQLAGDRAVLYQDTDSLHVTDEGLIRLVLGDQVERGRLGALRYLYTASSGEYRGWKDYTHDGTHCVSGLKEKARHLGGARFEQEVFESLPAILSRQPDGAVVVRRAQFELGALHPRAYVGPYGWTSPVRIRAGAILPQGMHHWQPPRTERRRHGQDY